MKFVTIDVSFQCLLQKEKNSSINRIDRGITDFIENKMQYRPKLFILIDLMLGVLNMLLLAQELRFHVKYNELVKIT